MQVTEYEYRASLFSKPVRFRLDGNTLDISNGRRVALGDIARILIHDLRGLNGAPANARRCIVFAKHGPRVAFVSISFAGLANFTDRSETFRPFVAELIYRTAAANAGTEFVEGMPLSLWFTWAVLYLCWSVLLPLSLALFFANLFGGTVIVDSILALLALAGMIWSLFYYLPQLKAMWPRRFDPRRFTGT
jgi:hypothetical protein